MIIDNEKNVRLVYEEISKHFSNTRKVRWNWVDNFINNLPDYITIYDLGCGNGRNMEFKNKNFIGIDNCNNFIEICKAKNLNVIKSNILQLPIESNSADAIICIAVFHHFNNINDRLKS